VLRLLRTILVDPDAVLRPPVWQILIARTAARLLRGLVFLTLLARFRCGVVDAVGVCPAGRPLRLMLLGLMLLGLVPRTLLLAAPPLMALVS
jgi:hypothetical protein